MEVGLREIVEMKLWAKRISKHFEDTYLYIYIFSIKLRL